jgi:outer membrane protein TolC
MNNEPTYQETGRAPALMTGCDGCSVNAMVDPAGMARGLRPISSGCAPWIAATQACLLIAMLVMAGGVMGWCGPAQGADQGPAAVTLPPGSALTFDEAVKIALIQCPFFAKSSLDIDIRRMDETDSRYGMVPPLTFTTTYYVTRPEYTGNSKPYNISFSTDPYNPVGAYFTLQAQKLVTQVAVLIHLQSISKGLERLGGFYLELDALQKLAACQRELVQVSRENLTYGENRMSIGTGTSLEVKVARQQLELALGEQEGIALSTKRVLAGLKSFLGLPSTQDFIPNCRDSKRQVMGSFDPATTTLEQAKHRSYDLKSIELYQQLQTYNIRLAKSKVLPTFVFTTQTPSPLNVSTGQGLYVGLGLQIPVWDGFKRIRNVSRQKAMLRQVDAKKTEKENALEDKWFENLGSVQEKSVSLKSSQALENLARLKAHQNDVRYQSGEAPLTVVLESRKEVLTIQKETLRRGLDYDKAVLQFRENSGDLGHTYVDERSWQK